MAFSGRIKPHHIRRILSIILALSFSAIVAIYTINRSKTHDNKEIISPDADKADLSINKVSHQATKDGLKQWDLTAEKASYYQNKNEIVFDKITVKFFMKNGKELNLTANTGILNTKTNDIVISKNIIASSENRTMETEKLHYLYKQHIIKTDSSIKLVGGSFSIIAEKMVLHLETQKARFDGNVNGTFSETINF